MSGARTSTFADPNLLLSTLSGAQTARVMQNQLLNQETAALMPYRVQEAQQTTGAADMEMMARASQGLLSLPDEASRAAAYPGVVASLQQQGYAKNAPSQYPGEARLRSIAMMGIPSVDLYKLQQANTALNAVWPGGGGTAAAPGGGGTSTATTLPIPGRGTGGPGASAQLPPEYLPYVMEASQKTGLPPDLIIAQMRQESGFDANAKGKAGEIGLMQIMPSTAQNPGMGLQGVDPATLTGPQNARNNILFGAAYLRAHMGNGDPNNPAVQASALHAYNGGGDPNYVANVFRYRPGLAPGDPRTQITTYQVGAPGTQVATAPGTAPPAAPGGGVAARYPGAVQAAGPAAGAPAATPGAPAAVPATPDLMGPRPMPPVGPGSPTPPTPQALANTPFPQPGANALAPGGPGNPPAAQPPAAPAAAPSGPQPPPAPTFQPPPVVPRPPPPPTIVADGLTAGQISDLNAMAARPGFPTATLAQRKYEYQQQNIQQANTYQAALEKERADAIQTQAAQAQVGNLALETWKAAHPDAKVTTVGGEIITQDPRTGAEIAPRVPVTPDRPEAMAMVTLGRIGAKIQRGEQLTPEEAINYNSAYQLIGKAQQVEDSLTHEKRMVYQTDMSGFPPPPGSAGAASRVITPGMSIAKQRGEQQAGEDFVQKEGKGYTSTNDSLMSLGQMNNAAEVMNKTPGGWTSTGPFANTRLALGQKLNAAAGLLGLDPVVDPAAIGSWESLNKQTKLMGFKMINAAFGAQREAASVIQNATSAVPGSENSYLGFRLVSSGIEQELARARDLYQYKSQLYNNGQPMGGAEVEFDKTHPPALYTQRAVANAVPDDVAAYLVRNPTQAAMTTVDDKFGPGIAKFILGGGRTGMGSEAARVP